MTTSTQPATEEERRAWDDYFKSEMFRSYGFEVMAAGAAGRMLAERRVRFSLEVARRGPLEEEAFARAYARGKADGAREERELIAAELDVALDDPLARMRVIDIIARLRATPEPKP
jgi:hypothetical protein